MAAPRCALDVWKYVHRDNAHRINQRTNQPTNEPTTQPLAVGMRRVQAADHACANFHPFRGIVDSSTVATLHLSRTSSAFASLPTSSPALLPVSSSPFTDNDGVCVYRRQSPSTEGFSRFFSPRVYPTPETSRDGGGGGDGRPEGAAVGIGTQPRQFSYRTT